MDKLKAKNVLHWIGFIAAIAASIYVAFIAQGLGIGERIAMAGTTLGALFVGLGKLLPTLDKAVDALPVDDDRTPIVEVQRPQDSGHVNILGMIVIGLLGLVLGALAVALMASEAEAAEPQFGGCVYQYQTCFGPSAAITVGQFNLATSKFSGGISPGIGYGATYKPDQWYATGLAAYLSFAVGGGAPNEAIPSLMLSFANYVRVGAGVSITETDGPVRSQWRLLFGLGSDFGGSPSYVSSAAKAARGAKTFTTEDGQ